MAGIVETLENDGVPVSKDDINRTIVGAGAVGSEART